MNNFSSKVIGQPLYLFKKFKKLCKKDTDRPAFLGRSTGRSVFSGRPADQPALLGQTVVMGRSADQPNFLGRLLTLDYFGNTNL